MAHMATQKRKPRNEIKGCMGMIVEQGGKRYVAVEWLPNHEGRGCRGALMRGDAVLWRSLHFLDNYKVIGRYEGAIRIPGRHEENPHDDGFGFGGRVNCFK